MPGRTIDVKTNPSAGRHRWIGSLFFGALLLLPVLSESVFRDELSPRSPWLYVYIAFMGGALLLSLVSVDFQLSSSDVRRNVRLCGLRIRSRLLVRRSELKSMCRTSTAVWEHKGALTGTQIDGYRHEVHLLTLEDAAIPLINFWGADQHPPVLSQLLADAAQVLAIPVVERFPE